MKLPILLFSLVIFFSVSSTAQKKAEKDSIYFYRMIDSFNLYIYSNYKTADTIIEEAIAFAKENNGNEEYGFAIYSKARLLYQQKQLKKADSLTYVALEIFNSDENEMYISMCYSLLGTIKIDEGKFDNAKGWFLKSLNIKEKIKDEEGIAFIYNNLGTIFDYLGDLDSASIHYFESLRIFEKLDFRPDMQSNIHNNISVIFYRQERYLDAIESAKHAAKINEESKGLGNLSMNYVSLANYYLIIDSIFLAKRYANKALDIANEINGEYEKLYVYSVLGDISVKEKNPKLALRFYTDFMKSPVEKNDYMISEVMSNMADAYFVAKQYSKAIEVGNRSLNIQKRIGSKQTVLINERRLSDYYSEIGNYKNAYLHLFEAMILKDSLFNENTDTRIREVEAKYQTEKKEIENQKLKQEKIITLAKLKNQKIITIATSIGLLFFGLLSFLFLRLSKSRKEQNEILESKFGELKCYNTDLMTELEKEQLNPERVLQKEITLSDKYKTTLKLIDISYIESKDRAIFLHTISGKTYKDWQTLKNYLEILPSEFFQQVSRSFIVNTHHIISKQKSSVTLKGDVDIKTSDKYCV